MQRDKTRRELVPPPEPGIDWLNVAIWIGVVIVSALCWYGIALAFEEAVAPPVTHGAEL